MMTREEEPPGRTGFPASPARIAILGAGICGLMTALALPEHGTHLTLIDKGRSVGGRMATRRMGDGWADHGAQFFTVRTTEFADYVEEWRLNGWIFEWATHWSDGSIDIHKPAGYTRFAAYGGMNALAGHIADEVREAGAHIYTGQRITALSVEAGQWRLATEQGKHFTCDILVATPPVPQTLALLETNGLHLDPESENALRAVTYAPCLCLLLRLDTPPDLPHPGARQTPDGIVTWVADNHRKGISPHAHIVTVHANPDFSAQHYQMDDDAIVARLLPELTTVLGKATVQAIEVKRWRYALPTQLHPQRFLFTNTPAPIYFGGDAFGGPRVEGAALSGLAIAAHLRQSLRHDQNRTVGEA